MPAVISTRRTSGRSSLRILAFLLLIIAITSHSHADAGMVLVGWDFAGLTNSGPSPYEPTSKASGIEAVGLTRGPGVSTAGAGNAWGGSAWDGTTDIDGAIDAGNFATFSITPTAGNFVSFSSIEPYNVRRSGTGPTTGQWQFQVGNGDFENLGGPITWGSITTSAGNAQSKINLETVTDLQNTTETVTFRVVNWDASGSPGTWYLNDFQTGDDFVITGTVTPIPEPSSLMLAAIAGAAGLAAHRRRRRRGVVVET